MVMRVLTRAAVLAFAADQISKYAVVHGMELARIGRIEVLPPVLTFIYGDNRGINFGLLDGQGDLQRWLLIGLSLSVVTAVAVWIRRARAGLTVALSAGLLIGGALGNVADRLLYGYVLDFLNVTCCGIVNPFVFNVADIFIFVGAIGLVIFDPGKPAKKAA